MIDLRTAERVANILHLHPLVSGVEVFGSIARDGKGNDLDIVLIVDDDRAADFIALVEGHISQLAKDSNRRGSDLEKRCAYHSPELRLVMAVEALKTLDGTTLLNGIDSLTDVKLDVFVFMPDWRDHLGVLQEALPHSDPNFMENIARDARPIP